MEFPVTIKDQIVYFGTRFDQGTGGGGHMVIDPEAMFTKVGLIIPVSFRSLALIDLIENKETSTTLAGTGCIVINSEGHVHKVLCYADLERKVNSDEDKFSIVKIRIPIGPHTTVVYGTDQHVYVPQLLAAITAGLSTTDAYEALAELQNLTSPYLVQFPIEYIVSRLKELGYTDSISKPKNKFNEAMFAAMDQEQKLHEKITRK